jgi:hypothetical protein
MDAVLGWNLVLSLPVILAIAEGDTGATPRSPGSPSGTASAAPRAGPAGRRGGGRRARRAGRPALEECGGMFVKLGQVLSTRADLLPVGWSPS